MSAVGAAIGIGGALLDYHERRSAAMDQRSYADEQERLQAERNKKIQENALENMKNLSAVRSDIDKQVADTSIQQQVMLLESKAMVEANAAFSGIAGGSVDQALQDLDRTYGQNLQAIAFNRDQAIDELTFQRGDIQRQADLAKTYQTFYRPADPNTFAEGLRVISAGLRGYQSGRALEKSFSESRRVNAK